MAADFLRQLIVKASPEAVMNALAALAARTETLPALSDFRFPALILVGSDDRLTPPACSETMRGRISAGPGWPSTTKPQSRPAAMNRSYIP